MVCRDLATHPWGRVEHADRAHSPRPQPRTGQLPSKRGCALEPAPEGVIRWQVGPRGQDQLTPPVEDEQDSAELRYEAQEVGNAGHEVGRAGQA